MSTTETAGNKKWYEEQKLTAATPNYSRKLVKYDKELILSILREGTVCNIGYVDDGCDPAMARVIPRQYGLYLPEPEQPGDEPAPVLYLHGPDQPENPTIKDHSSHLYRTVALSVDSARAGLNVCVTVSLVDGLGVARAAVHGTLAYRSVVLYGRASVITSARTGDAGDKEKALALRVFSDHVVAPGYWNYSRKANAAERMNVGIIRIEVECASAKVRVGEPSPSREGEPDDPEVWAGTLPITQVYGPAKRASYIDYEKPVPEFVQHLVRSGRGDLRTPIVAAPPHVAFEDRPAGDPLI